MAAGIAAFAGVGPADAAADAASGKPRATVIPRGGTSATGLVQPDPRRQSALCRPIAVAASAETLETPMAVMPPEHSAAGAAAMVASSPVLVDRKPLQRRREGRRDHSFPRRRIRLETARRRAARPARTVPSGRGPRGLGPLRRRWLEHFDPCDGPSTCLCEDSRKLQGSEAAEVRPARDSYDAWGAPRSAEHNAQVARVQARGRSRSGGALGRTPFARCGSSDALRRE